MPRTPPAKKGIYVYLDELVFQNLWEHINRIYPESTYGALSIEVQQAIVEYLRLKHAQIHTKPLNPSVPKVHQVCDQIIYRLRSEGFLNQVSGRVLSQVIAEVRGSDRRTVTKWTKLLVKNGYLKMVGTYTYEIL